MLLIRTYVAPSAIQGLGLFAAEDVSEGTKVWAFAPGLDQLIAQTQLTELPAAFRDYLARYAYTTPSYPGLIVLSCDHAKFMNHSEDPAIESVGDESFARRILAVGEEITFDYRAFVTGWTGFEA